MLTEPLLYGRIYGRITVQSLVQRGASFSAGRALEPNPNIVHRSIKDLDQSLTTWGYASPTVASYTARDEFAINDDHGSQELDNFAVDARGQKLQAWGYYTAQNSQSLAISDVTAAEDNSPGYATTNGYQSQNWNDYAADISGLQPQQLSNFATDTINQDWAQIWHNSTIDTSLQPSQDMSGFAFNANAYQSQTPAYVTTTGYCQEMQPFVTSDAGFHTQVPGNDAYVNATDNGSSKWDNMAVDNTSHLAWAMPLTTGPAPTPVANASNIMVNASTTSPMTNHNGDGDSDTADSSRPTCSRCGKTFGRAADLARHAGKHDPAKRTHRCPVGGCDYMGNYRKDKLINHVKNCHPGVHVS